MLTFNDPPQINDLQAFRSLLAKNGDLAKVAKFAVQIIKPGLLSTSRDLSSLCDTAELPGRAFHTNDVRYYGPTFQMPIQTVYNNMTVSFLCRDKFWERQFFDAWMNQMNPKSTYDFSYRDGYCAATFDIFQFSEAAISNTQMVAKYVMSLRKAYPINVNPMPLSWASEDIHRLQVTFAYTDWVSPVDIKDEKNLTKYDLTPGKIITNGSVLGSIKANITV